MRLRVSLCALAVLSFSATALAASDYQTVDIQIQSQSSLFVSSNLIMLPLMFDGYSFYGSAPGGYLTFTSIQGTMTSQNVSVSAMSLPPGLSVDVFPTSVGAYGGYCGMTYGGSMYDMWTSVNLIDGITNGVDCTYDLNITAWWAPEYAQPGSTLVDLTYTLSEF